MYVVMLFGILLFHSVFIALSCVCNESRLFLCHITTVSVKLVLYTTAMLTHMKSYYTAILSRLEFEQDDIN